jgi:hypothetical protein
MNLFGKKCLKFFDHRFKSAGSVLSRETCLIKLTKSSMLLTHFLLIHFAISSLILPQHLIIFLMTFSFDYCCMKAPAYFFPVLL